MPLLRCSPFSLGVSSPSSFSNISSSLFLCGKEAASSAAKADLLPTAIREGSFRFRSFPSTFRTSSSLLLSLLLSLSVSVRLSDDLLDLCLDLLSRLLRFLSRRLSLLFPRLCLSLLEDLFFFLRLSSLEELISDEEEIYESESLSDSDDSNSESEEVSESDEAYRLLFLLLFLEDFLCFPFFRAS